MASSSSGTHHPMARPEPTALSGVWAFGRRDIHAA
jgi:hypothetical protein